MRGWRRRVEVRLLGFPGPPLLSHRAAWEAADSGFRPERDVVEIRGHILGQIVERDTLDTRGGISRAAARLSTE